MPVLAAVALSLHILGTSELVLCLPEGLCLWHELLLWLLLSGRYALAHAHLAEVVNVCWLEVRFRSRASLSLRLLHESERRRGSTRRSSSGLRWCCLERITDRLSNWGSHRILCWLAHERKGVWGCCGWSRRCGYGLWGVRGNLEVIFESILRIALSLSTWLLHKAECSGLPRASRRGRLTWRPAAAPKLQQKIALPAGWSRRRLWRLSAAAHVVHKLECIQSLSTSTSGSATRRLRRCC